MGESLTPDLVLRYALAFGTMQGGGTIIVARDTRPSGLMYRDVLAGGLQAVGCRVVDIGVTPTPTALGAVLAANARGGVIITASHNLSPWNGMKFVGPDGSFLVPRAMERLSILTKHLLTRFVAWNHLQPPIMESRAVQQHIQRILNAVDVRAIRRRRFAVAIDSCNGAGSVAAPEMLAALGCRVIGIHVTPSGVFPRGPEPTPKNLSKLSRAVRAARADVGFAQDPDADRLSVVDETGWPLSEELTLALAVQHRLQQLAPPLGGRKGCVVVNLSTSRIIDDVAFEAGVRVHRTPVGEVYVIQRMRAVGALIGGEGNGGVIDPRVTWGRDSLVGMALILEAMARGRRTISELSAPLDHWAMVKGKLALAPAQTSKLLARLRTKFRGARFRDGDGVRCDLADGWVHVRPSNTEPVVRVFAEAATQERAQALYQQAVR